MPTVDSDALERAFTNVYRSTAEAIWGRLETLVDVDSDADGYVMDFGAASGIDASGEISDKEVVALGGFIYQAAADAATLPERLAFLALSGQRDQDLVENISDLWSHDGRPAIDSGARYGAEGQILTLRPGADPTDSATIRSAFAEARARIWDMTGREFGWAPEDTERFMLIHGLDALPAWSRALDHCEGPARLCGSLVDRWPNPRLERGEWYVIANAGAMLGQKPFAYHVRQSPKLRMPEAAFEMVAVFETRKTAGIVRVEPSVLVPATCGDAAQQDIILPGVR